MEEKIEEKKMEENKNASAPEAESAGQPQLSPIEQLQAEFDEFKVAAKTQLADLTNQLNREKRETARARVFGSEKAVMSFLPVFDNLQLALGSAEGDAAALREGVRMVGAQFFDALKNLGVSEIDPVGQPFSHLEHDAMTMMPVADPAQDNIVQTVVRKGFKMADRVIRPAMVIVGRYTAPAPRADEPKE